MKNDEPVAWMREDCYRGITWGFQKIYDDDIPLYTHPAKESDSTKIASEKEFWECYSKVCSENPPAKTLTDEEIQESIDSIDWNQSNVLIRFARAILRKAQE